MRVKGGSSPPSLSLSRAPRFSIFFFLWGAPLRSNRSISTSTFDFSDRMGSCMSSLWQGETSHSTKKRFCMRRRKSRRAEQEKSRGGSGAGGLFSRFVGSSDSGKGVVGGGGGGLNEEELHRLPERIFLNGATEKACLFSQQGRKGTNQDAMLVWGKFASRDDTVFCGVFDGHGPYGHMVAKKVRDSLPLKLCNQWRATTSNNDGPHENGIGKESMNTEETASISIDEEWVEQLDANECEKLPEMYFVLRQSLLKAFKLVDKELKLHETIDCFCSGSTAVTFVKQGQDLVIGNVGDSRAVLGTRDKNNSLIAVQLTVDLKPNLPREAARIQQCKGRVFALQDEPEVARVWLPNNDSPGLAMARAFGDFCLKDYGLISVPDISYYRLTDRDEFIVLATDGVWDVLSNKEVVDIVASAPTRATAARALVDCAVRAWRLKFPTSKTDDCAVVCLFLDPASSSCQVHESASLDTPEEPMERICLDLAEGNPDGQQVNPSVSEEFSASEQAQTPVQVNPSLSEEPQLQSPAIEHSHSGGVDEIVPVAEIKGEKLTERCNSTRSLADCISKTEEEEWSALEGVTRVNSLVNLPRFLSGDKKTTTRKK